MSAVTMMKVVFYIMTSGMIFVISFVVLILTLIFILF
jgi:hypothetical protein